MNTETLNLQASKAIQALGVEVESERWWVWIDKKNPQVVHKMITCSEWHKDILKTDKKVPAPNLQELLLTLPEIGEKLGWSISPEAKRIHAHHLLDIFLEKGMEGVSEEIIGLVENK